MNWFQLFLLTAAMGFPVAAQLTPDQREADLTALANYVAKYYAPATWKTTAFGVNPLDLRAGDYLRRARQAPNDLAYFEVVQEYVASFRDGHTSISFPSNFVADLGIAVDLYDDKPLIDGVNRAAYPAVAFPALAIGNEVISIDGVPVAELIAKVANLYVTGTGRARQRYGAIYSTRRIQSILPFAVDTPDESDVVILTADGTRETVRMKWAKSGFPVRELVRSASPVLRAARQANARPEDDFLAKGAWAAAPDSLTRQELFGFGARTPYYTLPADFVVRRGRATADFTYSGTYQADGQRIGYLRVPNFAPTDTNAAITELRGEIAFFKTNTDGLVLDVSHNSGGSPNLGAELMSMLTTSTYYLPGRQYLPGIRDVVSYSALIDTLRSFGAAGAVLERWTNALDQIQASLANSPRTLTGSIATIIPASESSLVRGPMLEDNPPLRVNGIVAGYDKPLIVLVDDLSLSHGEVFASMVQDNERGALVGYRTAGMGATIGCNSEIMPFSEMQFCNSFSLVLRRNPVSAPGLPATRYLENVGVTPNISLDFQTKANLLGQGRPFVAEFTKIIVEQIRKGQ